MTIVYFDLETGGLNPERHPIIQIGAVVMNDRGGELDCFQEKIQFSEHDCDPEALLMNHYSREVWEKTALPPLRARNKFSAFLKAHASVSYVSKRTGRPFEVAQLAAYNANFDIAYLRKFFADSFMPAAMIPLDVMQFAAWYFKTSPAKIENLKLATVAKFFDINLDGAHDALADARATAKVAGHLQSAFLPF